jgi:hypothetical protein
MVNWFKREATKKIRVDDPQDPTGGSMYFLEIDDDPGEPFNVYRAVKVFETDDDEGRRRVQREIPPAEYEELFHDDAELSQLIRDALDSYTIPEEIPGDKYSARKGADMDEEDLPDPGECFTQKEMAILRAVYGDDIPGLDDD